MAFVVIFDPALERAGYRMIDVLILLWHFKPWDKEYCFTIKFNGGKIF